jgi:serine/threonine protein kinase
MSGPDERSRAGSSFGHYQLRRLIARAGMAELYEAEDTSQNRTVALKLFPAASGDPDLRARVQQQAQSVAQLTEPHVVQIHGCGEIDGVLYIDMQLIDGTDLATILKRYGPLNPPWAVAIIRQVASALDAAHASDLLHRDVKPEDILITGDDFAYLVNFRVTSAAGEEGITDARTPAGTYAYMAPERFTSDTFDYRADIYSLACVLYECLTGATPYRRDSVETVITGHLMQPIPRPSAQRPGIPQAFDEVISHGMAKKPEDRYASAGDLARAAKNALAGAAPREHATGEMLTPTVEVPVPDTPPSGAAPSERATGEMPTPTVEVPVPDTPPSGGAPSERATGEMPMPTVAETPLPPTTALGSAAAPAQPGEQALPFHDDVQFTVFRPKFVRPDSWTSLLAFAHLGELPPGADPREHPIRKVEQRAGEILGPAFQSYPKLSADSTIGLPEDAEITFVLDVPNFEVDQNRRTFLWINAFHWEEFHIRAGRALDGLTTRGTLMIYHGCILLAEITLSIKVDGQAPQDDPLNDAWLSVAPYRKIFPSYSHRDTAIVEQFERFAEASGDEYLRDVRALRSGEEWDPRLRDFIDEAHVFQLFWSREAMASPNVANEWRYALSLNRRGFIRPTYWEQPMPTSAGLPPKELGKFHFHPFDKAMLSPQPLDAAAAINAPDELSPKQQLAIVLELRHALRRQTDDKGRHDIRRLLRALRRRPEATYAAVVEIDDILAVDTGGPTPTEAPTTTYRRAPTEAPTSTVRMPGPTTSPARPPQQPTPPPSWPPPQSSGPLPAQMGGPSMAPAPPEIGAGPPMYQPQSASGSARLWLAIAAVVLIVVGIAFIVIVALS